MKTSVIIPTCNRNDLLAKCLDALHPNVQHLLPEEYEVIVTDDSTENIARNFVESNYSWVKWVEGPKRGPAANRNNGAKTAQGEWIVFIDDDCIPQPLLLRAYIKSFQKNNDFKIFEGRIFADRKKERMDEEAPLNEVGGVLWSCNFMIEKKMFFDLKGFNEAFPYPAMEDVEFFDRVKKIQEPRFVAEASVMHPWRRVSLPFLKFKQVYKSHQIYFKVNPDGKKRFGLAAYGKIIAYSFFRYTIPDFVRYKGRGFRFPLAYHWFQLRILMYSIFAPRFL